MSEPVRTRQSETEGKEAREKESHQNRQTHKHTNTHWTSSSRPLLHDTAANFATHAVTAAALAGL